MAYVDESGVTTLTNEIKNYIQTYFLDLHYPVGSIYLSVNNTSPATLFGGTWEQIEDRFLLAAGSTYIAGSTGGETEHVLTIDEIPSHNHATDQTPKLNVDTGATKYGHTTATSWWFTSTYTATANTGGGLAHNNMPPYLVVYMWRRAA